MCLCRGLSRRTFFDVPGLDRSNSIGFCNVFGLEGRQIVVFV